VRKRLAEASEVLNLLALIVQKYLHKYY
jgi:hypothetical protein